MAAKNTLVSVRGSTALADFSSDNALILHTAKKEHRLDLQLMLDGIEEEYDCKTASEYALAEMAASSYVRGLEASEELISAKAAIQGLFGLGQKTEYCKMLSKEIDRANRQFTTAILTLKQLKTPTVRVNVRAKNAFIAQNQQFNNHGEKYDAINDRQ